MNRLVLVVMVLGLMLGGCASIFTQTTQRVEITSEPKDAKILVDGGIGQSPYSVTLNRGIRASGSHIIRVEKDGYEACEFSTNGTVNPWIFANILLGGLIGVGIDFATGACTYIREEIVSVVLYEKDKCDIYYKPGRFYKNYYRYLEDTSVEWYQDSDKKWKIVKPPEQAPPKTFNVQTGDPYRK